MIFAKQWAYRSPEPSLCPTTASSPAGSTRASATWSHLSKSLSRVEPSRALSTDATSSNRHRSARCPMYSESIPYALTVGSLLSNPFPSSCSTTNSSARHNAPLSDGLNLP